MMKLMILVRGTMMALGTLFFLPWPIRAESEIKQTWASIAQQATRLEDDSLREFSAGKFYLRISYVSGEWGYIEHFVAGEGDGPNGGGLVPFAFHQFNRYDNSNGGWNVIRQGAKPASDWEFLKKWLRRQEIYAPAGKFHERSVYTLNARPYLEIVVKSEDTDIRYKVFYPAMAINAPTGPGEVPKYRKENVELLKAVRELFKEFDVSFEGLENEAFKWMDEWEVE